MSHPDLAGKRVLLVEDEWLVAVLIEDMLTEAGSVVVGPFARVIEGLAAARTEAVDVALLDVNVGGEQVFPIAHQLEERGVPFLLLTGYGRAALPKDGLHWDAHPKPFDPTQLTACLAQKVRAA